MKVAVLGAGIMGTSTALLLSRRGVSSVVFDADVRAMNRASRWNEGKIHLGYLYAADRSLDTAHRVLPGGLAFKPLIESLIAAPIAPVVTSHDDTFLVHRDSVASVEQTSRYFDAVTRLLADHPDRDDYLAQLRDRHVSRLTADELAAVADPASIVAGFRVPERSIETTWVADRLSDALDAERTIELRTHTRVRRVHRDDRGKLYVESEDGSNDGPFDAVVNALWEGRLAVDASMGLPAPPRWSHRYRVSAFVRTTRPLDLPSVVICTGPFGDVKNYDGRNFYVSWYPDGLLVDSPLQTPPAAPALDAAEREQLATRVIERLAALIPQVREIGAHVESCRLEGGWVYAAGFGSLADPASTLHRRDRAGIIRDGNYISVDTGKYSIAPWLASHIAAQLTD